MSSKKSSWISGQLTCYSLHELCNALVLPVLPEAVIIFDSSKLYSTVYMNIMPQAPPPTPHPTPQPCRWIVTILCQSYVMKTIVWSILPFCPHAEPVWASRLPPADWLCRHSEPSVLPHHRLGTVAWAPDLTPVQAPCEEWDRPGAFWPHVHHRTRLSHPWWSVSTRAGVIWYQFMCHIDAAPIPL